MVIGVHHYHFLLHGNSYQITEIWLFNALDPWKEVLKEIQWNVNISLQVLDNNHAEVAPPLTQDGECWYWPVFGIYHPKKPGQIRCVFDSSATYEWVSMNSVLLSSPQLINSFLGVLVRFGKERIGIMEGIQKMFYSFTVREDHRNHLRFLWYRDNNFEEDLIEYRMRIHVFWNKTSPYIANYALHKTAEVASSSYGEDVRNFVHRFIL